MAKIFYDKDADLNDLKGQKIAIIGYGSQGHAHALNLQDSGLDVIVGLRAGSPSRLKAKKAGLKVTTVAKAAAQADLKMILINDEIQKDVYEKEILPTLKKGDALLFGHGFNIRFGLIKPPADVDVLLVAPKGPGHTVRSQYMEGVGVPNLLAVEQNATRKAWQRILAYSKGIGGTRAGAIRTTFTEETETDLFGEQTILCGGVSHLIQAAFETLVEAGYQPECAYFECQHELKLITDMIHEGGIQWMRHSCSDTAEYGDYTRGPRIITKETKKEMKKILGEIQSGKFAKQWILENKKGRPRFNKYRKAHAKHPIEKVGVKVRGLMSWLGKRQTEIGKK